MRAVLKNKGTIKKQEQPSMDENHAKKRSETTIYSKTKATKTETPTPRPVIQTKGKRNSTAPVNSFHGNASYTHQTPSVSFGKSGSKTRSVRRRPLKFDHRSLLQQTKEQEKQKESYEDMMEKFKKLRNCRYLRWRNGQDPYLNDTFDMPEQTRIVTLPLPLTTGGKLGRKSSFRQANRSFFSASVVAVTSVGVSQK
ncbi:hypothetical protein Bbelb_126460 [Branchiostoma belcheri]|nr:hypothetical protein Bbelb_126460 [Branchiostoma belcheri]